MVWHHHASGDGDSRRASSGEQCSGRVRERIIGHADGVALQRVGHDEEHRRGRMMKENDLRATVLLGVQVALLGCIGLGIRKVLCRWNDSEIRVRAIFDGEIREEDAEAMLEAETENHGQFSPPRCVDNLLAVRCTARNPPNRR